MRTLAWVLVFATTVACGARAGEPAARTPAKRTEPARAPKIAVEPAATPLPKTTSSAAKEPDPSAPPEPEPVRHPFHEPLPAPEQSARAPAMRIGNLSPGACRQELAQRKLAIKRLGNAHGVATPLRIAGPIRDVRFVAPGGSSPYGLLDCRLALVLDELAEVLAEHGVVAVRVDNFYRPRARLPGRKKRPRSQHAHGLAMDVTSFELADGRRLVVERDWHGEIGAQACGPDAEPSDPTEETVLLRNLVCAIVRRGIFHHVLTPNYDAAHRDHLHLDVQRDGYKVGVR